MYLREPRNKLTAHTDENSVSMKPSIDDSTKALNSSLPIKSLFRPKKERKVMPLFNGEATEVPVVKHKFRYTLGGVMFSRAMDSFILVVIIAFSALTFVSLTIDDLEEDYVTYIEIVELILLFIFLVELLLKFYSIGWVRSTQNYLKGIWNLFDFIVVVLSLTLASFSFVWGTKSIGFLKFSVILRLFRLTVAFRKFGEFRRIKEKIRIKDIDAKFSVDMNSERVLTVLSVLLLEPWLQANSQLCADVRWCMEIIRANKLNETIVTLAMGSDAQIKEAEILDLVNQFSLTQANQGSAHYPKRLSSSVADVPVVMAAESELSIDVAKCLSGVDSNDFDIFELRRATNGHELFTIMHLLFTRQGLFSTLQMPIQKFKRFVSKVQSGYNASVPYHNATHAADVTQTIHYFLTTCAAADLLQLTPLETAASYLSGCVHDYEHPGVNNAYLVNTQSELAIRYNDRSVLENHHVSASFALAMIEDFDIYANMTPIDFAKVRSQIIDMVLSTDISQHFSTLSQFKNKFPVSRGIVADDRNLCFQVLIHAADISNPSKPWSVCHRWTRLVMAEFWAQGDKERDEGLPISYMMDRYTVNIAKTQIGFIDVIVWPTFDALKTEFPALIENCSQLLTNRENWIKKVEKYEEKLQLPAPSPRR